MLARRAYMSRSRLVERAPEGVLVSQLNERARDAARAGLRVEVNISKTVSLAGDVLSYPTVSIRVTAEVQ